MNAAMKSPLMQGRNVDVMGPSSIRVSRSYAAKPENVFKAWTDPASIGSWLTRGEYFSADVRAGGLFYLEMRGMEKINPHYGRYLRVESPRLLEFTWVSEWTQGKESVVLIELSEHAGKTELTLTHDGLPNEDLAGQHRQGWTGFLEKLEPRR
jgi:uncharacterized protein YndB with AHSA1/START domain